MLHHCELDMTRASYGQRLCVHQGPLGDGVDEGSPASGESAFNEPYRLLPGNIPGT